MGCRMRLLLILLLAPLVTAGADIKLQSVERKISLTTQFARVTESLKVKNTGSRPVDRLTLCQPKPDAGVLAYQKVTQAVTGGKARLQVSPTTPEGVPEWAQCWEAVLRDPIAAGQVGSVDAAAVYAGAQTPFPASIGQGETQLVVYLNNVYVVSPYTVSTQATEVVLPSPNVKSYTATVEPVVKTDKTLKFGKYDLIQPWTQAPLRVHYESNKPFRTALSCVREIEVSHWGNIYVEESYEVKNAGAKHKGPFSRLRFAHTQGGASNAFQELKARLPASAHSLYYVDIIGNISTSDVRKTASETILEFETRYPLMGGWKVDFKIGYSLPLPGFLHRLRSGRRRLTVDLSTPIEGLHVQDLTVKVVLPEGSTAIQPVLPYELDVSWDTKYTYLDVSGRPVLVLRKAHLVPEHAAKLAVEYSFPAGGVLREPLLLIAAFATLFAAVIGYNRLEFTIARDERWRAGQDADKVAAIMQAVNSALEEQDEALDALVALAGGVTNTAAADASTRERGTLEATFNSLEAKAKALLAGVAATQPRTAEKVTAVQERLRGVQQRLLRLLADRIELVRKGTSLVELDKKLGPTVAGIKETRQELTQAVETLFAPY